MEPGLPSYMVVMTHLTPSLLEWYKEGLGEIKNFYNHSAVMRLSSHCISISHVNMGSRLSMESTWGTVFPSLFVSHRNEKASPFPY